MFKNIHELIHSRLENDVVLDSFSDEHGFFGKVSVAVLPKVVAFLKNDPDVKLALLDHIVAVPKGTLPWKKLLDASDSWIEILYLFTSLKLPYRVGLVIDVKRSNPNIKSISSIFSAATWLEEDLTNSLNVAVEDILT